MQVRACWMCGIRLPISELVPDGGSACPDVRWYCRDTWGCTRRWTSHSARLAAVRPDVAEPSETPEKAPEEAPEEAPGLVAAKPLGA